MILTARWAIPDIARARTPSVTCRSGRITDRTPPPAAGEAGFPEALFAPAAAPAGDELALPVAAALSEQAKEAIGRAIAASRSPNTRRNYQTAWRAWEDWARGCGYQVLPARAETVAEYLTERAAAGAGASTLGMALAAIAAAHGAAGETDPTRSEGVRRTVAGLRREAAGGAQRQARPRRDNSWKGSFRAGAATTLRATCADYSTPSSAVPSASVRPRSEPVTGPEEPPRRGGGPAGQVPATRRPHAFPGVSRACRRAAWQRGRRR